MIKEKLEDTILNAKTQAKPLPVTFVGRGAIIFQRALYGDKDETNSSVASVANAVGAAYAQLTAIVDTIFETDPSPSREQETNLVALVTSSATEKCVRYGAKPGTVRVIERQVMEMAYVTGKIRVIVKVVGHFHRHFSQNIESLKDKASPELTPKKAFTLPGKRNVPTVYEIQSPLNENLVTGSNLLHYQPHVIRKNVEADRNRY